MTFDQFWKKVRRKLLKMRLQPIRVFCFHQVSNEFEPDTMWERDWTQTEQFKRNVIAIKGKYTFISLPDVTEHLRNDRFRLKHYAALTADDGWASSKNILPWLVEQRIPITLFLNPLYLDGLHFQSWETDRLLTEEDVVNLVERFAPFVTIASHGWSHKDCMKMTEREFADNVVAAEDALDGMQGKIPYYAFTFGRRKDEQVDILKSRRLTPVFMDGEKNLSDDSCIHRELLDGKIYEKE